jgi:hypothetical protein
MSGSVQSYTVNFDESTGVFDTVNLVWDNADGADLEIYGISVRKDFI